MLKIKTLCLNFCFPFILSTILPLIVAQWVLNGVFCLLYRLFDKMFIEPNQRLSCTPKFSIGCKSFVHEKNESGPKMVFSHCNRYHR